MSTFQYHAIIYLLKREGLNEPSFYIILLKANDSFCSRSGKTNGKVNLVANRKGLLCEDMAE